MKKNKYLISKEKVEFIQSLEEFFIDYEPKFGEKIKVRRFLAGLKKIKRNSNWVFLIIILIVCLTFYLMTIFRMMS